MTFDQREYPFKSYQKNMLFTCDEDIDKWLIDDGNVHSYCALIKSESYIFTPQIQEYLIRYKMQNNFGITSYSSSFEEVPARWIDMLNFIETEIQSASKEKQRLGQR